MLLIHRYIAGLLVLVLRQWKHNNCSITTHVWHICPSLYTGLYIGALINSHTHSRSPRFLWHFPTWQQQLQAWRLCFMWHRYMLMMAALFIRNLPWQSECKIAARWISGHHLQTNLTHRCTGVCWLWVEEHGVSGWLFPIGMKWWTYCKYREIALAC